MLSFFLGNVANDLPSMVADRYRYYGLYFSASSKSISHWDNNHICEGNGIYYGIHKITPKNMAGVVETISLLHHFLVIVCLSKFPSDYLLLRQTANKYVAFLQPFEVVFMVCLFCFVFSCVFVFSDYGL